MNTAYKIINTRPHGKFFFKVILISSVIIQCSALSIYGQAHRTEVMGGLKYSVIDEDNSLTPYDFSGNPAWLYKDKSESYVNISTQAANSFGSYRRLYDSEGSFNTAITAEALRDYDSLGTLLGSAAYGYENRRKYYRSLKMAPYAGEALLITDTTAENFSYNGPLAGLTYSWNPFPRLYAGGSASYQLLEGLKEKHSYAQTTYRNAELNAGLAYEFTPQIILGTDVGYFDSQETIEASDVNLLEVTIRNYRGESYYVSRRSSTVTEKIRKTGMKYGAQFYYHPISPLELAVKTDYSDSHSRTLVPYGSFVEEEEGYASFKTYSAQVEARYSPSGSFTAGAAIGYSSEKSWTKNSWNNLVLWEWNTKQVFAGAGASYKIAKPLLLAAEFELSRITADSIKHIDRKDISVATNNIAVRTGAEYRLNDRIIIRAGYNASFYEHDIITGGKDVSYYAYTFGGETSFFSSALLSAYIKYETESPKNSPNKRSSFGGVITLRLYSFN